MSDADQILGAPYKLGGRDPETGIDCLGVTLHVLHAMGIEVRDPWRERNAEAIPTWDQVPLEEVADGDVIIVTRGVGAVKDGYVYTSHDTVGGHRLPVGRFLAQHPEATAWRHVEC